MRRVHPNECWAILKDVILRNTPDRSGDVALPEEAAKLESQSYQREVAFVIADGINYYLSKKQSGPVTAETLPDSSPQ